MSDPDFGTFPLRPTGHAFQDFEPGQVFAHHWGRTLEEGDNALFATIALRFTPLYFNVEYARAHGHRLVFGLVTGSIVIGLATQDTAENALAELRVDGLEFRAPVFHGDTLTAYTEVLETRDAERDDAGVVRFKHWGVKQDDTIVFEGAREVLIKRRSHWRER